MTYKILLVHDIEEEIGGEEPLQWAYARRTAAIKKYAPSDFEVHRVSDKLFNKFLPQVNDYDLVFALDYSLCPRYKKHLKDRKYKGVFLSSFNKDTNSRGREWVKVHEHADWVVVNNHDRWMNRGGYPNVSFIPSAVDTDVWQYQVPFQSRKDRVIWTGGTGPKKKKGYHEVLLPLKDMLAEVGIELDLRPVTAIERSQVMTTSQMVDWYNSARFVVCASATEGGGPNFVMEAMACGCVPLCTAVGGIPEYIIHAENGYLSQRTPEAFCEKLKVLRSHPILCEKISNRAITTIRDNWSYTPPTDRAGTFYELFRKLIETKKLSP